MRKYFKLVSIIAIIWSVFQLYQAGIEPLTAQVQRAIHVSFALALTFALISKGGNSKYKLIRFIDPILVVLSLFSGFYVYFQSERLVSRIQFVSQLTLMDYIVSLLVVLLVLEASRRTIGNTMTILGVLFLFYSFFGDIFPGIIKHDGLSIKRMTEVMYFSMDGILGVPIGVATEYVFYFILFAAFLELSGGGNLFIDLALRATKKAKGGPAKAAIFASGGMGSVSGSAVANVVSTGIFTIPLMKKAGFSSRFAASIEALASTGGQILPPVMGAAAFLMADTLGVKYQEIALAALIPALIYYIMLYAGVHFYSGKIGLSVKGKEDQIKSLELLQKKERIIDRIHLLLPLVILIYFIFSGKTLQLAAFWSIISVVVISYFRKSTRMSFTKILDSLENGAKQAIQVTIPCAVAGIVVGAITHSGLGIKFSGLIIQGSLGIPILATLLVAAGCIILGMGMPTTSAYIMAAVLLAPSMASMGFNPIASHMFILYFACFSMITPPVALASYSAASIAGSDANKTGFYAFYLSLPAFLIAFSFVFNPALLLIGTPLEIIISVASTLVGVVVLMGSLIGYLISPLSTITRLVNAVSAGFMILPNHTLSLIGFLLFFIVLIFQIVNNKSELTSNDVSESVEYL